MSLNVYMDVHVPSAITRALRRRGIDVLTAQDDGTGEIDDSVLLDRAAEIGRILLRVMTIYWLSPSSDGDRSWILLRSFTPTNYM